ncbi:MAG: Rne/Rng family ribonuclease [Armatimonadota bacterium]
MTKEIIVNAGELESRVAILENGRLMELHVEREPKIIGNIYKGRVTKVLKGMDAAFVDIGVERNAFLAVSDVVHQEDDEGNGHGRMSHRDLPPITQLLHANQEILVQVVRAPMGTKGARITTRLSLPGRYVVLMLNGGTYVGVSRKIEDPKERQRLREIAHELRPESYSLIVRTEAEGKTREELVGDVNFLVEMAHRIEKKADHTKAPALIHGDLTLIFRLIRDAFTSDVKRVVVDSESAYENAVELVGMIAPHLRNRIFLYEEALPLFHAYNIEPEIDRILRRKVWLPSGGHLSIDQAEALTAIDVNTGRFVGSTELSDTVLTTNLQAAEEVARQLRLRDLGGIIVVDFIDMDNPRHRQQVTKAFEEALKRDRAKIKMHSISPLGLVEMTRKRTGESLGALLTEPCPYCSGIGRVQNPLTMALRVERDLAAMSVEHPDTEAYLVVAHPRVIASMLGYEGEAQHDLEQYVGHPVYLRTEEEYHPNVYRLERLTLEQALATIPHIEEGEVVEGVVVNPDPELSLSPLVMVNGINIIVPELDAPVGMHLKVKITEAGTSFAQAEPMAEEFKRIRPDEHALPLERPPLVDESALPMYLREERALVPPRGLALLSPTAESMPLPVEEFEERQAVEETDRDGRRKRRRKRVTQLPAEELPVVVAPAALGEEIIELISPDGGEEAPATEEESAETTRNRRRRRRRRDRKSAVTPVEEVAGVEPEVVEVEEAEEVVEATAEEGVTAETPTKSRRRRGGRGRRRHGREVIDPLVEPIPEIAPDVAAEAMLSMLNAIGEQEFVAPEMAVLAEPVEVEQESVVEEKPTRRRRSPRRKRIEEAQPELVMGEAATVVETPAPEPVVPEAQPIPELAPIEPVVEPVEEETPAEPVAEEKPKRRRRAPATSTTARAAKAATAEVVAPIETVAPAAPPARKRTRKKVEPAETPPEAGE